MVMVMMTMTGGRRWRTREGSKRMTMLDACAVAVLDSYRSTQDRYPVAGFD